MEQLGLVKVGLKELEFILLAILGLGLIMVVPKQELVQLKVIILVVALGLLEVVLAEKQELVKLKVGPIERLVLLKVEELELLEVDLVEELVQLMVALEKLVLIFKILVPF